VRVRVCVCVCWRERERERERECMSHSIWYRSWGSSEPTSFHVGFVVFKAAIMQSAVWVLLVQTFRTNASPPSSGWKDKGAGNVSLLVTAKVSSSRNLSTMKMEAIRSSETSLLKRPTSQKSSFV
jgi:hypothetical protein